MWQSHYSGIERKVTQACRINYNLAAIAEAQTDARYSQDTSSTKLHYDVTKMVTDMWKHNTHGWAILFSYHSSVWRRLYSVELLYRLDLRAPRAACGMEQQRGGTIPGPAGLGSTFPCVLAATARHQGLILWKKMQDRLMDLLAQRLILQQ